MYKRLLLFALPLLLFACNPEEEDAFVPNEPDQTEEVVEDDPAPDEGSSGSLEVTDKDGNKTTMQGASISLLADDGMTELIFLTNGEPNPDHCGATMTNLNGEQKFAIAFVRNTTDGKNELSASFISLPQPDGTELSIVSGFCYLDTTDPELFNQETHRNTAAGDAEMYNTDIEITRFDDEVIEGTMKATYYIQPEQEAGPSQVNNEELELYGEIVTAFKLPAPVRCN